MSKPRSTDGGNRWTAASKGIDRREFPRTPNQDLYKAFTLDEHQPSRLVLGGQSVWQTLDSGATWTGISQKGLSKGANVTAVAIAPSQRETLYAATSDGRFWATFDGGTNWLERDQGLPIASGNATLDIAIDPAHPNHVFIQMTPGKAGQTRAQTVPIGDATQGRVWMTIDGGSSWTRLDCGIPTNLAVRSLAVDWLPGHLTLYAGTDQGVFFSSDLGMNWASFGRGLPRARRTRASDAVQEVPHPRGGALQARPSLRSAGRVLKSVGSGVRVNPGRAASRCVA